MTGKFYLEQATATATLNAYSLNISAVDWTAECSCLHSFPVTSSVTQNSFNDWKENQML